MAKEPRAHRGEGQSLNKWRWEHRAGTRTRNGNMQPERTGDMGVGPGTVALQEENVGGISLASVSLLLFLDLTPKAKFSKVTSNEKLLPSKGDHQQYETVTYGGGFTSHVC